MLKEYFQVKLMYHLLLVADNEPLPEHILNTWNKTKSIGLLRFYGEENLTDDEGGDENSKKWRTRMLQY